MNLRNLIAILLVSLVMGLNACGSPEQANTGEQTATQAADTTADAADEAAETTDAADLASVEESVESDDIAAENTIELTPAPAATQAEEIDWQYNEGEHFRRLTTSQGTSSAPDKIEIAEIFWDGCPHCYNFEPVLSEWKQQVPADVSVVKIPVIWNPTNQIHARIMYTAEALGVLDKIHPAAFDAMHQQGIMLTKDEEIVELFAGVGIAEDAFREAYGSFGVTSALKRAENLTRRYGIRSVPILVVNGKYVVEGEGIKTFGDMLGSAEELVERERRDR